MKDRAAGFSSQPAAPINNGKVLQEMTMKFRLHGVALAAAAALLAPAAWADAAAAKKWIDAEFQPYGHSKEQQLR